MRTRLQTDLPGSTIYFDTCCLSRLFDIQTQQRVRQEAEAVEWILTQVRAGYWNWISSNALIEE